MQTFSNSQTGEMFTEFYQDVSERLLHQKMDEHAAELKPRGYTVVKRQKIGRNEQCPCGSGRKFKRCCIALAR